MAANETPPFWFEKPGVKAWALWPFSVAFSRASARNMLAKPSGSVGAPVLCIGNFVAGGGGKTPTALEIARLAKERGLNPGFLSRGYGGRISGPEHVNLKKHNAHDVGDEPLLLARQAPTVISADRLAGAEKLIGIGCDFIIMDDGFQNPKLLKDYCLVVVDSRRGAGNGFVMPAGPLRVNLKDQMLLADSVLVVGKDDGAASVIRQSAKSGKPIALASLEMINKDHWKDQWLLPFAGIADPQKFFDSLARAGGNLAQIRPFADHHFFSRDDVTELLDRAKLTKAKLVTTAKDFVRLIGMGEAQERLAKETSVVQVKLVFEDVATPGLIIDKTLERYEARELAAEKKLRVSRSN